MEDIGSIINLGDAIFRFELISLIYDLILSSLPFQPILCILVWFPCHTVAAATQ